MATVTFLYFDDCPNWSTAHARLQDVLAEREASDAIEMVTVDSHEAAVELGFRGSPTILIDGVDPFARGDEPVGLSCRVYQTPEGMSGAPTIDQLRAAIAETDTAGPNG